MTERIAADASATRAFFVDMLVRDISVDAAIFDLIDNAVDAATRQSPGDTSLDGFRIEVTITPERFAIMDSCGGIAVETARDNAFRFGRPQGFDPQTQIGQFGIGMKRAVFRLGSHFRVESSTRSEQFVIDVDVDEWRDAEGSEWTFPMDVDDTPGDQAGTTVEVEPLHSGTAELFSRDGYPGSILREIVDRYGQVLRRGLQISVNNEPADLSLHELLSSDIVAPEHQRDTLWSGPHAVELRIISGIGPERRPISESGWYVYCNGRLVLKADRTEVTGWGTGDPDGGSGTPAWHPQYGRFRGFVFFLSDHPSALPWTTTKTEIDESAEVYRNALPRMRSCITKFANYTNALKQESEHYEDSDSNSARPIRDAVAKAPLRDIGDVPEGSFQVPERASQPATPPGPKTTRILFHAEATRVDELKDALSLSTNRQVGEQAFERLYEEEIGD